MVFYAGCIIREPAVENPTVVVLTHRNGAMINSSAPERKGARARAQGIATVEFAQTSGC